MSYRSAESLVYYVGVGAIAFLLGHAAIWKSTEMSERTRGLKIDCEIRGKHARAQAYVEFVKDYQYRLKTLWEVAQQQAAIDSRQRQGRKEEEGEGQGVLLPLLQDAEDSVASAGERRPGGVREGG